MSNLVAIIPARGGSKRFPGKNLAEFKGKPLIWHTIEAVAPTAQKLVVASDSAKILDSAQAHPDFGRAITPHRLESDTTSDTSTVLDSVLWMLAEPTLSNWIRGDAVLGLFLPTAPLRTTRDIENALTLLSDDTDGVISTTSYEFPPQLALTTGRSGHLVCPKEYLENSTRSQDYQQTWRPNGAIYLHWGKRFMDHRNFFRGRIASYFMPRERSLDIDTAKDLKYG